MNNEFLALTLKHLQKTTNRLEPLRQTPIPHGGWLRAIRQGLGMSRTYLAKKIGVKSSTLAGMEQAEIDGTASLKTLKKIAEGMDCVLVYAVIPKTDLSRILENQAVKKARALLQPVVQTMRLENQAVSPLSEDAQLQRLKDNLLKNPRQLWR